MNNQNSLQTKNSVQSVHKVNSPNGNLHFFGNGDSIATNHLKVIQYEYQTLQEGIQHLENMIKYAAENHENLVRDKFLVKKNRLSRKKREIYEQEQQLQRQEMELNSNPQIKRALFDLAQLKEFHERKERQYLKIQEVINKEDETLKALKYAHEMRIDNLKQLISVNIETQMRIDKMKKYLKLLKRPLLTNSQMMSQPTLPGATLRDSSIISQSHQQNPTGGILITQTGIIQNSSIVRQQNKANPIGISLEQTYQSQLPTINTSTSQNISKNIVKSNIFKNIGQSITNPSSTKSNRNNSLIRQSHPHNMQRNLLSNSVSVPTLLRNIKQSDNNNILSQNSSIIQQQASIINPSIMNQNASSILATHDFEDMASIEQAHYLLINELDQIKRETAHQKREIERKKQYIFKGCSNQLQMNGLVKECFNLVTKKLTSTLSMSDRKGFKDSMYLTMRNNSVFVTQNEQIVNDFKELQHNNNVNVQDRLLGSIVFDSMMNIIKKQEQEKLNKQQLFPDISYKNFSQFTLGQILTIITLKPELKDQLFLPFELKKQTIHLFLEELQKRI